ncbi:MAG: hypothetical protein AABY11_00740 [archaeon]
MGIDDLVADLNTKAVQLEETRRAILTDTGEKLDDIQEKVDGLLTKTDERISEVERRAAKTLELEEKITSGLTEQVEVQANRILEDRVKDLRQEMQDEVIQLKKMGVESGTKSGTGSSELQQKIVEAETKLQNLDAYTKQFLETLKNANLEREDQVKAYRKRLDDFENASNQRVNQLDMKTKQLDAVVNQLSALITQWNAQLAHAQQVSVAEEKTKKKGLF